MAPAAVSSRIIIEFQYISEHLRIGGLVHFDRIHSMIQIG